MDGDRPDRLREPIAELPGDTEHSRQMAAEFSMTMSAPVRPRDVKPVACYDLPAARILADGADKARAQYPGLISAWMFDSGRGVLVEDELFTDLVVEAADTTGPFILRQARGPACLDCAVEHVNHRQTVAIIPSNNSPSTFRPPAAYARRVVRTFQLTRSGISQRE